MGLDTSFIFQVMRKTDSFWFSNNNKSELIMAVRKPYYVKKILNFESDKCFDVLLQKK